MYSYRRRKTNYYRGRKINKIYSPSMMKYNKPSFVQKVGRTLQTTPRNIQNNHQFMASRPKLDEMYKILQQYKYPLLRNITLKPFITSYSINKTGSELNAYADGDGTVTIDKDFVAENFINDVELPNAPDGYNWKWGLGSINFNCRSVGTNVTCRFTMIWDGPFLINGQGQPMTKNLITKSVDTSGAPAFQTSIICIPGPSNGQCKTNIVVFANASITNSLSQSGCIDIDFKDNGYYMLLTNDEDQPTNDQIITFNVSDSTYINYYNFTFNFIFYLV